MHRVETLPELFIFLSYKKENMPSSPAVIKMERPISAAEGGVLQSLTVHGMDAGDFLALFNCCFELN
jgi:hypothetical protein